MPFGNGGQPGADSSPLHYTIGGEFKEAARLYSNHSLKNCSYYCMQC